MNNPAFDPALDEPAPTRQDRQKAEILDSIDAGRLQHAADLAHEHLAEFPDDRSVRSAITAALQRSPDDHVRRRANEFVQP
ncbi:MAG TPA: hypothetical protein VNO51_03635 [Ilumatobacteraceae bacterium]|nr:hypothetical protein [Ilumatobacteraceae bacterium]